MDILVCYIVNPDFKITIWSKTETMCEVQEYRYGKKSKRAMAKIKYYNNKPYITCKGHRYYLDQFIQVTL